MPVYRLPPGPHVGGRQPYAGKDLNPSVEDVPVNDPPFDPRDPMPSASWWATYPPLQLRESTPAIFQVVVVSPVLKSPLMPSSAWWAAPPVPIQATPGDLNPAFQHVPVNDPPFDPRDPMPAASWWTPPLFPTQLRDMAPGIPGQSVDAPPLREGFVPWSPLPVAPNEPTYDLQRRYLVQPFVAQTADSAPFSQAWQNIIRSWQRGPDLPTLPRILNASLTAVPEDSPIPEHPNRSLGQIQLTAWFAGVLPDRPAHFGYRSAASPGWSVDDPPRFRPFAPPPAAPIPLSVQYPKLAQDGGTPAAPPDQPRQAEVLALRWWAVQSQPAVLPRQLAPGIPGQSADAPPARPASQQPSPAWYADQRPIILPRQLAPGVPGQSVDAPPGIAARQPARAWYDGLYPVPQRAPTSPDALSPQAQVDAPPVERQTSGWNVAHWFAPYVAPQRHRPLAPFFLDVRVDSPPFDHRRLGRLASIVARSQIPTPDRVYLRYVVQEGPAVVVTKMVCGTIVVGPVLDATFAAAAATSGSMVAVPALSGEPDTEECD